MKRIESHSEKFERASPLHRTSISVGTFDEDMLQDGSEGNSAMNLNRGDEPVDEAQRLTDAQASLQSRARELSAKAWRVPHGPWPMAHGPANFHR
jgi:hypothetical protein